MTPIVLPDEIAEGLQALAERKHTCVEDLMRQYLLIETIEYPEERQYKRLNLESL